MMDKKQSGPLIVIKRFIVLKGGGFAYDQKFKYGVNIIRGDNGTGKSTVMDLLYYGLGAEVTEWTDEQEACSSTIVEALLNYKIVCLKREITETGKAPMYLYDGELDRALIDTENWYRYPNTRNSDTHSYSQQIFELLGLPSHKTDDSKNLTMHQIMRLLYVDQLTEATKLLKEDKKYDNSTIRRAIGEYLLGIDDLEAHNIRQELIEATKTFESVHGELKAIYRFLGSTDSVIRKEHLLVEIEGIREKIVVLEEKRDAVRQEKIEDLSEREKQRLQKISKDLSIKTEELTNLEERKGILNSEIIDIKLFLDSLYFRKQSLEKSKITSAELGEVIFKYCPACLSLLDPPDSTDQCGLCKSDISGSNRHYAYIQMINEINFQIKESKTLQDRYKKEVDEIVSKLPMLTTTLDYLKRLYTETTANGDAIDSALSEIGSEIGFYRSQINHTLEKMKMLDQVEALINKKAEANEKITEFKEQLEQLEEKSRNRVSKVYSSIEESAKDLITSDGGYESVFDDPEEVTFDFDRDKMAVNGRSKFSASSMVIMKNSIRAAIFIHSVKDSMARFPRFLMMDNMEDKGMTAERSQNFQRVLVKKCEELMSDYQLIFTTSMIDEGLDKSDYVVGPFYKKGKHTLKIG